MAVLIAVCGVAVGLPEKAPGATLNFVNGDGLGEGFNDPGLGAARIAAFEYALGLWSDILLDGYAGETISVYAQMNPLGGSSGGATLGQAGATSSSREQSGLIPNTWYGMPLLNHVYGSDYNGSDHEINATFNSSVDEAGVLLGDWYYGTDALPTGNDVDFVTVVLHEIGHGLNFASAIAQSGTLPDGYPGIYDRFLIEGATGGTALTSMTDAQRANALTSNDLYWMGEEGVAGNGGVRPRIHAPAQYEAGSSVSHLDETVHNLELMSPEYDVADHEISSMELGMLSDMGWTIIPEPGQVAMLLGLAVMGIFWFRRRK